MFCPNLNALLRYKNPRLISRYTQDYPNAKLQADDALGEFMKFVWLCNKHKAEKQSYPDNPALEFLCTIHPEMCDIDSMWHTFLLFTKDYQEFCNQYLAGTFFHHEPLSENAKDFTADENYEQELTRYLSYIYDNLGEETVVKWFETSL